MMERLSANYQMPANALLLKYVRTQSGDWLLARTLETSEDHHFDYRSIRGFHCDGQVLAIKPQS
jgi:hypothetical protein